jgi:hypothetical protein
MLRRTQFWLVPTAAASFVAILAIANVHTAPVSAAKVETPAAHFSSGKVDLKSAGRLAFGPNGVLFVGDSMGGTVVALDTNEHSAAKAGTKIDVQGVDEKIAGLAGTTADQIVINDVKVNPISKNVYVAASRGKGPDAMPVIARVDTSGKVSLVSLDNAKYETVSLTDAPAANPKAKQDPRTMTITDLQFVNGNLMVAGLSNEEWSSALRSIPYPFQTAAQGATLQIWHSSHGRYETQAPIRTFVPYKIDGKDYVLAAYTCTPLVKIPFADLKPGAQIKGLEIADLGMGNQPIDMVPYKKDGHDYILIANNVKGLIKLKADNLGSYAPIAEPTKTDVAGVPYDSLTQVKDVQHLASVDGNTALIVTGHAKDPWSPVSGPVNLQTIALP